MGLGTAQGDRAARTRIGFTDDGRVDAHTITARDNGIVRA
jgi:hypothetical protein